MCVRERDSAQREREQKSLAKGGRVAPGGSSPLLDLVSGWSPNSTSIKAESQSLERSARSNYREGARARGGHSCGDGVSLALYTLTASPILHSRVYDFLILEEFLPVRSFGTLEPAYTGRSLVLVKRTYID